jgi:hypothetical protein
MKIPFCIQILFASACLLLPTESGRAQVIPRPAAQSNPVLGINRQPQEVLVIDGEAVIYPGKVPVSGSKIDGEKLFTAYYQGDGGYAGDEPGAGDQLVELLDDNLERVGFVHPRYLLLGRKHALRVTRADGNEGSIYRKALMVTNFEQLDDKSKLEDMRAGRVIKTADGKQLVRVPALRAPGLDASVSDNIQSDIELYEHYVVWKESKTSDGQNWLLVGRLFETSDMKDAGAAMLGWVPKKRTQAWDTAQAVEPDWMTRASRTSPQGAFNGAALVVKDEASARNAMMGLPVSSFDVMSEEDMKFVGQMLPEQSRFPLLETKKSADAEAVWRVGFIGGIYGEKGLLADKADWELQNARREKMTRGALQLDLVILIDGTKSMERFRAATIEAVKNVIKQVRTQAPKTWQVQVRPEDLITRCFIGVYRNRNDVATGPLARFEYLDWVVLQGGRMGASGDPAESDPEALAKVESFVNGIQFDSSERTNRLEAVYDGVVSAVQEASRGQADNPDAYKMMILVGDSGDESREASLQDAAQALNGTDVGYDFYAVSVTHPTQDTREDYAEFRQNMVDLAGGELKVPLASVAEGETYSPNARLHHLASDAAFIESIKEAYGKGIESRNNVAGAIVDPDRYPMRLREYVMDLMRKRGVKTEILETNKVQLFGEGWTTEYNQKNQRQWQIIQRVERKALMSYLALLAPFKRFNTGSRMAEFQAREIKPEEATAFITAITSTFSLKVGQLDGEAMETYSVERMVGDYCQDLPVRTNLLKMTIAELRDYLSKNDELTIKERATDLRNVALCEKILQAYVFEQPFSVKSNRQSGAIEDVDVTEGTQRTKYFIGAGDGYAWIPEDYFP